MSELTPILSRWSRSGSERDATERPHQSPVVFWTVGLFLLGWVAAVWISQTQTEAQGYQETTGLATFDPETTPSEQQGDKQVRMMCLKLFLTPVQGAPELRLRAVDPRLNFLLVLGVQKAGTTWLFDALATHPLFSGADHGYRRGRDKWAKEVHFFDQSPPGTTQEYLECFSAEDQAAVLDSEDDVVFLDATPAYLRTPAAAPRVQQVLPHAKFVIVLRDPVARYLSAYSMIRDNECPSETELCDVPSFSGFLSAELSRGDVPEECFFNVDVPAASRKTWSDCFSCKFTVMQQLCKHLAQSEIKEAAPFTHDQVEAITGFQGNYSTKMYSPEDVETLNKLKEMYTRPNQDLQSLMDKHFPSIGFEGLHPEL